jgi:cytochrome c biogenesis protein CcmG/thiol:disulfide interchange protein DsbE
MTHPTPTPPPKRTVAWLVWPALALILLFFVVGLRNAQSSRPAIGDTAPSLDLVFYEGYAWEGRSQATLEDLRGNVVLLNFWASWCAPCRQEARLLEQTWRDYRDRGVIFLGVAWSDTDSKAYDYLAEYDITYPNAPDLRLVAQKRYNFTGVPETWIIDRDGTLRYFKEGPFVGNQLQMALESVLRE